MHFVMLEIQLCSPLLEICARDYFNFTLTYSMKFWNFTLLSKNPILHSNLLCKLFYSTELRPKMHVEDKYSSFFNWSAVKKKVFFLHSNLLHLLFKSARICGLYYKNITIVNDASRVVMSDAKIWSVNCDSNWWH